MTQTKSGPAGTWIKPAKGLISHTSYTVAQEGTHQIQEVKGAPMGPFGLAARGPPAQNVAYLSRRAEDGTKTRLLVMTDSSNSGSRGTRATVKWFNSGKGFGFVTMEDGTDAFCHVSALGTLDSPELPAGATVYCDVSEGQRGMQVSVVYNVDLSTAESEPPRGTSPRRGVEQSAPSGPMGGGHVKFFNEQKGFGFVVPESEGPDIYLHASALRRSGISNLLPEQRIRFSTRQGTKGIEVDRIEIA